MTPSSLERDRPDRPWLLDLDQVPYLTNSSMMDVDFLPRHLIVLGGSYVGLEFAQLYRRFGSKVTVCATLMDALSWEIDSHQGANGSAPRFLSWGSNGR